MTPERLLARLPEFYTQAERDLVRCACVQAFKTHSGQLAHTGRLRLEHPLCVATILAELGLDAPTVCAGVLHDVLLDGKRTLDEIDTTFGGEVTRILRAYLSLADLLLAAREIDSRFLAPRRQDRQINLARFGDKYRLYEV